MATRRVPQGAIHNQRNQNAGSAERNQRYPPAMVFGDPATDQEGQEDSQGRAETEYGHSQGALPGGEIVRYEGMRRRRTARLADPHKYPEHGQLQERPGKPAHTGHQAPQRKRPGDDFPARAAVRKTGDGNAEQRIENSERRAGKETDLGVRQRQVGLDLRQQNADQIAVGVIEGHHQQQQPKHVAAIGERCPGTRRVVAG